MAGALSLQEDILSLVQKHGDTCLPEDLLARLGEEARLLAVREHIRSLHEADRFGLFSEPSDDQPGVGSSGRGGGESGGSIESKEDAGGDGAAQQRKKGKAAVLPDNVKRMLGMMKISRFDKVAALSGFTTIDAEVEFSSKNASNFTNSPSQSDHQAPDDGDDHAIEGKEKNKNGAPTPAPEEAPPIYLAFRFRREPLSKSGGGGGDPAGSDSENEITAAARQDGVEMADLDDENGSDAGGDDGDAIGPKVGLENLRRGGGKEQQKKPAVCLAGKDGVGLGLEGRKRSGSRGGDSDGGGGGGKGRKRSKGLEQKENGEDVGEGRKACGRVEGKTRGGGAEEASTEEECNIGCYDDEPDGEGLNYVPKTLVSYTISGGIGFARPDVLLQAVVYARGDGPACVMPPPAEQGDGDEASASPDQEDVFDCNVDGPALAAVGRALGLHTDPPTSDSESNSDSDDNQDRPSRTKEKGVLAAAAAAAAEGEREGDGGMTLSDLVWWVMLFPFFEKEFDMVDVVASSVFGDDESDSDDGEGESESDEDEDED